ncbi:MAG TPA: NAD(P)H-hydrate epimerase, partial [Deltaproteobacteria bacterium]|nr:NAD(P)H-hydrate epimerase [Deltaproteobacteria bacterium]
MKVSNVSEMRAMDSSAMVRFGIPEEILMENAGEGVCSVIRNEIGIVGKKFIIFCGLGNNGGDGFVVARKLFSNGAPVRVVILGDGSRYRGAAALNLDIVARLSIPVQEIHSAESIKTALYHSDVVIDAIFGTGLARPVEGMYRDVIQLINGSRRPVVSADIPSGIAGDTGKILGECIRADFT